MLFLVYCQVVLKKIRDERTGLNPYGKPQTKNSRRFIYCNTECISLIHASYRDTILDVHFVLRSSEVKTTFENDLEFLYECDYIINTAAETHVGNSIVKSDDFIHSNIKGVREEKPEEGKKKGC